MPPHYNRRTDPYGGYPQNRSRMRVEAYEAIHKAVGNDFSIWVKINVVDGIENGVSFDDVLYLCDKLTQKKMICRLL
jgi:2,4-dienoyl-CoA reductase-like NADH-dependent reductase (Old Yellow Enzyme family)